MPVVTDKTEMKALTADIEENLTNIWDTKIEELNFENKEFIDFMVKYYTENVGHKLMGGNKQISDDTYYQKEMFSILGVKKFVMLYNQGRSGWGNDLLHPVTGESWMSYDYKNELPFYLNLEGLFFITNVNFYYNLGQVGKVIGDQRIGKIPWKDFKTFEIGKGVINFVLTVNGEEIGSMGWGGKNKNFIVEMLRQITMNHSLLFPGQEKESEPQAAPSVQEPIVVKSETDIPSQIKQLKELLDQDILTEDEFNTKKQDLLDKM